MMFYYGKELYSPFLYHHGILGQKWGIRRFQNKDGSLTAEGYKRYANKSLKKAKTANLDKWGTDEDHNVLYISGYSGSGKSTLALNMSRPRDKVIHLDGYSESEASGQDSIRNREFNKYLDKHVKNWREMSNATNSGENGTMKRYADEYWDIVNNFHKAINDYGKSEFKKGNRVVVEGIQIADNWLVNDKKYYVDKPIIVMGTNAITSMKRAFERDDRGNLIKGLKNLDSAKEYINWYSEMSKNMGELSNIAQAKRGESWVKEYLKRNK